METQKIRRYSMAFKRQVVEEYEKGASETSLKQKYGIKGATTIKKWVKKYGREGYRHEVVYIQTVKDTLVFPKIFRKYGLFRDDFH